MKLYHNIQIYNILLDKNNYNYLLFYYKSCSLSLNIIIYWSCFFKVISSFTRWQMSLNDNLNTIKFFHLFIIKSN